MQRVTGYMRKAITEFQMIENGDRIASAAALYRNRL